MIKYLPFFLILTLQKNKNMALKKFKQVNEDSVLANATKAEYGIPKFAHINELVTYINALQTTVEQLAVRVTALETP